MENQVMNKATLTVIIAGKNKEPQIRICADSAFTAHGTSFLDAGRSNDAAPQSGRVAASARI
jgi:hypothetical protein